MILWIRLELFALQLWRAACQQHCDPCRHSSRLASRCATRARAMATKLSALRPSPQTAISPRVELEGFERVHLRAGEARTVELTLTPRQLSEVDEKGNRAVLPGDYAISVAGAQPSPDTPTVTLHVAGTMALPQ